MTPSNRIEAQQQVDAIRTFSVELQRLEHEQVLMLTDAQHHAVAAHHNAQLTRLARDFDIDHTPRAKQLSLGMRIVSLLGALALAASVFFLFYQFWGWLSPAVQVATLISASLASFAATLWIARKDSSGYFAKLAAMVAFCCFVLNIVMLGQIFNITPSDKALLPWAVFALLLAYTFDLRLLLVAGMLCLIAFLAARVGTWSGMYWIHFGERPENFFPAAVMLFFVPLWVDHHRYGGFAQTYRIVALLTLFLPMLILANWGSSSYLGLNPDIIEGAYQTMGFITAALAVWLGVRKQWNEVTNTGVTFFLLFMYTKMFDWWWEVMPKYLFFLVLGLTAILLLLMLRRVRTTTMWLTSAGNPA